MGGAGPPELGISIHALRVEGDVHTIAPCFHLVYISIHALRVEGDPLILKHTVDNFLFLSTPSGWRATLQIYSPLHDTIRISIHALRVEGDRQVVVEGRITTRFLSTPSGWRATLRITNKDLPVKDFYPRPPGGGRLDQTTPDQTTPEFLSTPSGWRATRDYGTDGQIGLISIHALRVEGDLFFCGYLIG